MAGCRACGLALGDTARFCGDCGLPVGDDNAPSGVPRIDGVEDLEEIGRGGFGVVFRGREATIRRTVAVKVLLAGRADERSVQRWRREVEAMGRLSNHANIVSIFRTGTTDTGADYLVMPFVSGGSLADQVGERGPLSEDEVVGIGQGIAKGLAAAHGQGVLHRDLKPANVLVNEYGEPQLTDFGIARLVDAASSTTTTIEATIPYAPPEVLSGKGATERSDVYGLGATLYALLAAGPPFLSGEDEEPVALVFRVLTSPAPDLRPRGISEDLVAVIEACMAKDPADRPGSAAAVADLLRAVETGARPALPVTTVLGGGPTVSAAAAATTVVPPAPADPRPAATGGRRSGRALALLAAGLLLVVGAGVAGAVLASGGGDDDAATTTTTEPDAPTTEADVPESLGTEVAAETTTTVTAETDPPETTAAPFTTTTTIAEVPAGIEVLPGSALGSGWVARLGSSDPGSTRERTDVEQLALDLQAAGYPAAVYDSDGLASRSAMTSGFLVLLVGPLTEGEVDDLCATLPADLQPYGCVANEIGPA